MAETDSNYYNLRSRPVLKRLITNKTGEDDAVITVNDSKLDVISDEDKETEEEEEEEEEEGEADSRQTITIRLTIKT